MTISANQWRAMILLSLAVCLVVAVAATGQGQKPAAGAAFGTVDVQRVTREYKAMQTAQAELTARQNRANARIQRWMNMPYLSEEELRQLDAIESKDPAARTAEENAKAKELTDKGIRLTSEIAALMQKSDKDLTDADKQRLKDAEAARTRVQQRIEQIRDEEDAALRDFGMSNQEKLTQNFRASVKKVAEKRGLAIVFDVQFAIYAGVDITDDVIKDLNSK